MSEQDVTTEEPATAAASPEPAPEPAVTETLGEGGKKALEAERAARRAAEKTAADLAAKVKEFEDSQKSEAERLASQLAEAEAKAARAEAEALRLRIAAETDLPADLHEFLVGNDEDDLRAKAEKLKAATAAAGAVRRPQPDPTQGAKPDGTGPSQLTRADLARMKPDEINEALEAGRLTELLANKA